MHFSDKLFPLQINSYYEFFSNTNQYFFCKLIKINNYDKKQDEYIFEYIIGDKFYIKNNNNIIMPYYLIQQLQFKNKIKERI